MGFHGAIYAMRRAATMVVHFALPPRCPGCGVVVSDDHQFCVTCWQQQHFLRPPWCALCHMPLPELLIPQDVDAEDVRQCGPCLAKPPRHDGMDAVMAYDDVSSRIAVQLKHGRRIGYARMMARFMAKLVPEAPSGAAHDWILVPVPLHRWRIWGRGFNQSAMVADAIMRNAQRTGRTLQHVSAALVRTRRTPMLRGKTPKQRQEVIKGAIRIHPAQVAKIRGRNIILIDDVYTTGATTEACVKALKSAGAAKVRILCWTRVLPDGMNTGTDRLD